MVESNTIAFEGYKTWSPADLLQVNLVEIRWNGHQLQNWEIRFKHCAMEEGSRICEPGILSY